MGILKHNPDVTSASIEDQIFLFEPRNAEYIILNQCSSKIWELIKEEKYTFEKLIEKLLDIFNVEKIKCERETKEFISLAINKGILIVDDN